MKPFIVFAHGAGAPSSHSWMRAWTERLATLGDVHTFDYPYMRTGRRAPDRQPVLIAAHEAAIADARKRVTDDGRRPAPPLVLAGKSMGARIGCHVAAAHPDATAAIVCLGFPLGTGDKAKVRARVLADLRTPVMFVQGEKDSLCPLADLEQARKHMTAPSRLHVIEGGNHSLEAPKRLLARYGKTQHDVDTEALAAIAAFLRDIVG